MKRLLFVGPSRRYFRSFMQRDLDLLKQQFDVRVVFFCWDRHNLKSTLVSFYSLITGIAWADTIFCWLADFETFFAVAFSRLYQKKTVVVAGGVSVVAIPEIKYGYSFSRSGRFRNMFVLNKTTKVLPYSKDAEKAVLQFVHDVAKVTLIYLGVDIERFHPSGAKKDLILSVGTVNRSNLARKGLETFVKSAEYLPDMEFVLIGQFQDDAIDYLRSIATKNVRFAGAVPEGELIRQYQQAKVYVQVSAHEAFGVALAEAMACGCVCVVTNKGAIPEVVGGTGVYVPYGDVAATAEGIKRALESKNGTKARQRIGDMFTLEKRRIELLNVINDLFC